MILWGLNVVAVKFLVEHVPPIAMQSMRIFIAGMAAIIVLYFLRDLRKLTKQEWAYITFAALLGQLGHHALLAVGIMETTASNASLILGLIPLTTVILTMIFFKERLTWLRSLGITLGFVGVTIVVVQGNGSVAGISRGDLFVFISMVLQALSFIVIKKVTATLSSKQMTAVILLLGSLFLFSASLLFEPQGYSQLQEGTAFVWSIIVISAVLATGLGHIFYNAAIQEIGAGQTAIFNNLVPFFSLIGAFFFLGEQILFTQVIGFILIVTGVILGTGYMDMKRKDRQGNKKLQETKKHHSA
ncbi:drug/metabolite transporter (DMT)-like permease [Evansella vedderi]|uniref:Drug/metabolite transporter (DMT)-like permease n=2 Tax=Evansella vedderi TaxID=38282 RepID=A0ABT9ZWG4_9BACI|nr:drug/metabolite transporter (DMT)-like permease [Evansella vedderi]